MQYDKDDCWIALGLVPLVTWGKLATVSAENSCYINSIGKVLEVTF